MQGLRLEHASADLQFLLSDLRMPQLPHRQTQHKHKSVSVSAELMNLQGGVINGCVGAG